VKNYVSPHHVIGNGLRDGPHYFAATAPTKELLGSGIEAGLPEAWLRGATASIGAYPSEAAWKQNVDLLVDCQRLGVSVMTSTKTWTTATQAQKDAWFKFALASYLLGNDGTSYFFFSYSGGDSVADYPLYHLDLGAASAPYAKVSGVYQRNFAKGKVLVNPTTSTFTVPLGGTYETVGGSTVTSVTLPPHTAEIVRS
jgi:putative glycosyl hydrolase-like family 15 (GHL15) protein